VKRNEDVLSGGRVRLNRYPLPDYRRHFHAGIRRGFPLRIE
jgi:hypothetical protein